MAVLQPSPELSVAVLAGLWDRSCAATLDALEAAVRVGALSPGEAGVRRTKVLADRDAVAGELRELARRRVPVDRGAPTRLRPPRFRPRRPQRHPARRARPARVRTKGESR